MGDAASCPKTSTNCPNSVLRLSLAKQAKEVRPVPAGSEIACACLAACRGTAAAPAAAAAAGLGKNWFPLPFLLLSLAAGPDGFPPPPEGKMALNTDDATLSTSCI